MKKGLLIPTPLGAMAAVEEDGAIVHLDFAEHLPEGCQSGESPLLSDARLQLEQYFAGERSIFDLPIRLQGTPFQQRVWQALLDIPYGHTRTYGEIAAVAGNAKASRAVGSANHNNPISLVVPCHRVIGAGGKMVGYGGGLWRKEALLQLERDNLANARAAGYTQQNETRE